jgi:hypothetical protein
MEAICRVEISLRSTSIVNPTLPRGPAAYPSEDGVGNRREKIIIKIKIIKLQQYLLKLRN